MQTAHALPQSAHPDTRLNRVGTTPQTAFEHRRTSSDRHPMLLSPIAYQRPGGNTHGRGIGDRVGTWTEKFRSLSAKRSGAPQTPEGSNSQNSVQGFF